jgi:hypothetical protein
MREAFFLKRGLIVVAILLGSTFVARTSDAAEEFRVCDLFSIDDAEQLIGQPIVNTVERAEDPVFLCEHRGDHAAAVLQVRRYSGAEDARAHVPTGTMIAGLGDANNLLTIVDYGPLLTVVKGPYVVILEVWYPLNEVTADDLAPRVQAVLDYLAAAPVARPASPTSNPPCPFTNDRVVSPALGIPVHGYSYAGSLPGYDTCEFGDFTIIRQSGPDIANKLGLAGLARNIVLGLPTELATQVGGLGAGRTLDLPPYQIATPTGLGDAALWVKDSSFGVDALVVQRGNEVFIVQVLDRPDAQAISTAVARAVLANAPVAEVAVVPSGKRPEVAADCGLDAANAVADRLQRADVTRINVIGGCHYVSIETTLDGSRIANAGTAQQICDIATEVAYHSGILGITVTERAGGCQRRAV